jgi:hypothetical protein
MNGGAESKREAVALPRSSRSILTVGASVDAVANATVSLPGNCIVAT